MCGDKWANIFCQMLRSKPGGSCLEWRPLKWLKRVGYVSWRHRKWADRCVSALFVCVLYCGTMVVRLLDTSGHSGVWPGADGGMGLTGFWPWGWWWWAQTETRGPLEARARPIPALPLFSWLSTLILTATHVIGYKWVLIINLGVSFLFFHFANHCSSLPCTISVQQAPKPYYRITFFPSEWKHLYLQRNCCRFTFALHAWESDTLTNKILVIISIDKHLLK